VFLHPLSLDKRSEATSLKGQDSCRLFPAMVQPQGGGLPMKTVLIVLAGDCTQGSLCAKEGCGGNVNE
jgi:hypothetical protein